MKPAAFAYNRAASVDHCLQLLTQHGAEAKLLAGGQSLIPVLNMRLAAPAHLIDISRLSELDSIEITDSCVRVGAAVTHAELEADDSAHAALPILRQALVNVAHPAIRNRGTTVGSIAHADPNGEMPAILALTGGTAHAVSSSGSRQIDAADLFIGPLETCLETGELITHVDFNRFPPGTRTGFTELARRSGDYALAGVAMALTAEESTITGLRLSFVSVTDLPEVLDMSERVTGLELKATTDLCAAVTEAVETAIEPAGDIHATADYRRHITKVMARRLAVELSCRPPQLSSTNQPDG